MKKKKILLLLLALILVISVAGIYFIRKEHKPTIGLDPVPAGLTKVPGYVYHENLEVTCDAITPECGECFGQVINKECYVDKTKLSDAELKIMNLK